MSSRCSIAPKKGLTNHEIANILGLAVGTIKYYKTLAFKKSACAIGWKPLW